MDVHCINIDLRSNSTANPQFSVASQNSLGTFNKRKISYIDGTKLHLYCISIVVPIVIPFVLDTVEEKVPEEQHCRAKRESKGKSRFTENPTGYHPWL